MLDAELTKWLATLGIGGVLAAFMFMFYRKDVRQYTDLWKSATDQLLATVEKNTASNTKLITLIEVLERNSMRKDDIERIVDKKIGDHS